MTAAQGALPASSQQGGAAAGDDLARVQALGRQKAGQLRDDAGAGGALLDQRRKRRNLRFGRCPRVLNAEQIS